MSKAKTGKKASPVKIIIIVLILAVIGFIIYSVIASASLMAGIVPAEITQLQKKDLENTVSVSGIVESQTFRQVSANLSYTIDSVNVEVGDKVKAGDILATLSTDDLQNQIVQQQSNIDSSNINTQYSVSDAEKRYNDALAQINDGTYPEIYNAKLSLDNAEEALRKAKEKYDEQVKLAGSDKDNQLISAKKGVESAKYELDCAYADYLEVKKDVDGEDYKDIKDLKKAYDDAKKEYDSRYSQIKNDEITKAREAYESALTSYTYLSYVAQNDPASVTQIQITDAQKAYAEAEAKLNELEAKYNVETTTKTYEKAMDAYTKAKADIDTANSAKLKNAERSYERAKASYDNAVNSLNSVKNGTDISLDSYSDAINDAQNAVDKAREAYSLAQKNAQSSLSTLKAAADREKVLSENDSQLISLEILKEKLDDCVIKAPCDGTITQVNATEGAMPTGTLFIIEDTENLKMTASVKEYNISELKEGLEVTVTIPSLNNREFSGVVSKIAPAGTKGMDGKSDGTASFNVEIIIHSDADSGILIGMTSKCKAVTSSKKDVFAIGYDALVEEADGSCYVYTIDRIENANGTATARKIAVDTGFECDAEIEIISPDISEGMDIVTNSGEMSDGAVVLDTAALGNALQQYAGGSEE